MPNELSNERKQKPLLRKPGARLLSTDNFTLHSGSNTTSCLSLPRIHPGSALTGLERQKTERPRTHRGTTQNTAVTTHRTCLDEAAKLVAVKSSPFPELCVSVKSLHDSSADILWPQLLTCRASPARRQQRGCLYACWEGHCKKAPQHWSLSCARIFPVCCGWSTSYCHVAVGCFLINSVSLEFVGWANTIWSLSNLLDDLSVQGGGVRTGGYKIYELPDDIKVTAAIGDDRWCQSVLT